MIDARTPEKARTKTVITSPKPNILNSELSPFLLTFEQAKSVGAKIITPKSRLLENKYFFIDKNHKSKEILGKYITEQGGVVCQSPQEREGIYCIAEKNDDKVAEYYHSDVCFALCNTESNLDRYLLSNYTPAPSFSKWNKKVLDELNITVNYMPLIEGDIWFSSTYDKEEVENLKNLLLEEFNKLCESTNYSEDNEQHNRRFVYTLFDLFVRRFNKNEVVVIKQFQEVYIRNIDLRYGYGKVDMIIGEQENQSLALGVIYFVIETKAQINDNNCAQIVGELIACYVANQKRNCREIYAILTDGTNIQFYMLSDIGRSFVIDRSEALNMGKFQGIPNQKFEPSKKLEKIIRVLISLFGCPEQRPLQRRLELLSTVKNLSSELENMRNENAKTNKSYEQRIENMKQKYEQIIEDMEKKHEQRIENMKQEYENMKQEYEQRIENMEQEHEQRIEDMKQKYEQRIENMEQKHEQMIEKIKKDYQQMIESNKREYEDRIEKIQEELESIKRKKRRKF
jgi:F0F1-type ATP synthase membrane subunit b/b'